jgi:hypothetical protein
VWYTDTTYSLQASTVGIAGTVNADLSMDGGTTWSSIATGFAGGHSWQPSTPGTALIRYTAASDTSKSVIAGPFTVASTSGNWADVAIAYTTQYSPAGWSANQATGAPDTYGYGDQNTAYAPGPINGSIETITLGYITALYTSGVDIRETIGNGFVTKIELHDQSDVYHTVWASKDPSIPGYVYDFVPTWTTTTYLVDEVRITLDTNHNPGTWDEIDAVRLLGHP